MNHFFRRPKTLAQFREAPLGPYLDSYAERLHTEEYSRGSARQLIRSVAQLSVWLRERGIDAQKVTRQHVELYPRSRIREVGPALRQFIRHIHPEQFLKEVTDSQLDTPLERLKVEFDHHLQYEKGLASSTRRDYIRFAHQFLKTRFPSGQVDLACLEAADVTGFVRSEAAGPWVSRAEHVTFAIRCFLRFAHQRGYLSGKLAGCVPKVAHWKLASLPNHLLKDQVEQVLANCNRQTARGKRDFAVLLLLARLGLRGGEVAALTLDNIDWHNGTLTVRGKGDRKAQFPMGHDVGAALADYLQNGRPRVASRIIFCRALAPAKPLHGQAAISSIVRGNLQQAGVTSVCQGAHLFRHTLATELLRHGASLTEIGEVLRHRSPDTTARYAKVDLDSLRSIVPAWPGGER
ncbi:MAG: site-specific integrase [Acidobacteriota bacterium]